jgi:hypothetical protein
VHWIEFAFGWADLFFFDFCYRWWGNGFKAFNLVSQEFFIDASFDIGKEFSLTRNDECECDSIASHSTGSSNSMNVVITVLWHVIIDDVGDSANVDASAHHIGSNQDFQLAIAEAL